MEIKNMLYNPLNSQKMPGDKKIQIWRDHIKVKALKH